MNALAREVTMATVLAGNLTQHTTEDLPLPIGQYNTTQPKNQATEISISEMVGIITDKYVLPVVMVVGIIGNILNIVTLTRREMRSPTVQILIAMSSSDLIVLLLQVPHLLMLLVFNDHKYQVLYYHYFVFCRYPLSNMLLGFTLWLSVLVTLERCLAFNKSQKNGGACGLLRFFCSQKDNATRMIVCVFICSCFFNALRFFEYEVNPNFINLKSLASRNSTPVNAMPLVHRQFMIGTLASAYFWSSAAMHNIVPMITMISLTYVLARRIRRHDKLKARLVNPASSKAIVTAESKAMTNDTSSLTSGLHEPPSGMHSTAAYMNSENGQIKMKPSSVSDAAFPTKTNNFGQQNQKVVKSVAAAWRRAGVRNHTSLSRTITILVICIVILFILTDSLAVYLVISIAIFSREVVFKSEVNRCFRHVSNLLVVSNSSCNFILFCSTSKQYRTLFIGTLNRCLCRITRKNSEAVLSISDRQSEVSGYPN